VSTSGTGSLARQLEGIFTQSVQIVQPSVVQIESASGLGSGVVLDDKGNIVTNAHVVAGARRFRVTLPTGRSYAGRLIGSFPLNDLAVVRVQASGLRPARMADSSKLRVGEIVLAVGNPLGLRSSVTQGIVSALGRTVSEPGGAALPNLVQTSAAINPGNSGGALVDLEGRLVGVPTLAAVSPELGAQAPGIGFAIPSNTVRDIAGQIIAHGQVVNSRRAYLGVRLAGGPVAGPGALVIRADPGGPAHKAGIRAGHRIVAVGGRPTPTPDELAAVLAALRPGQVVTVSLVRADGGRDSVKVTLGQYPGR
jgi:S1-C subfamily serine protease